MIVLDGQSALSAFRIERLNQRLAAAGAPLCTAAWFTYFIDGGALDDDAQARLRDILRAEAEEPRDAALWVVPRFGTISPWSSKATEILRGVGLDVRRVVRAVAYRLADGEAGDVVALLHDPMTESVLTALDQAPRVFFAGSPAPLQMVPLGDDARAALVEADRARGLALADAEIDYLAARYREFGRDPTDAELMMFAQANSEHCRHKIFNARWTIDGEAQPSTLFGMIRYSHDASPARTLSAYSDNAAVIAGGEGNRFIAGDNGVWHRVTEPMPYAIKVETHNHPTAIAPWPGAATGAGGEIRDEGAVGRGGKPKAGLTGFSVSHLRIPGTPRPWETERPLPPRFASAFEIMRDAPLGAAAFNNEFGRPCLGGYFRSFEQDGIDATTRRGYDKPIMIAGGLAQVRPMLVAKGHLAPGDKVIVLGGPSMLIGLGGGAASSMAAGESSAALDFASVQRDNPEMQRRCQAVIDACTAWGDANPIVSIHDVGAGGLSNAVPEILHDSGVGGRIDLRAIPTDDPSLSPMQLWSNESQERYVIGLREADLERFAAICARERCPFAVIGEATADLRLVVADGAIAAASHASSSPGPAASGPDSRRDVVDLPLDLLFGATPPLQRVATRLAPRVDLVPDLSGIGMDEAVERVLRMPAVGSKSFLVTIGDRSVGGLVARDPMVGPWQVPVADCAITLADFDGYAGEAMAMSERAPVALLGSADAARMAVGEVITNLLSAPIGDLGRIRLSANWMAAADQPGDDAALFDAVRAVGMELGPALGISIPVGKDSLSMRARWQVDGVEQTTLAPVSLVVSGFAPVDDVRGALTPQLALDRGHTDLWLLDLGGGRDRLGGSALTQAFNRGGGLPPDLDDPAQLKALAALVSDARRRELLLAYHDRSDGGVLVTLLEMAFASHCGLEISLDGWGDASLRALFAEELGAVVQVASANREEFMTLLVRHGLAGIAHNVGHPVSKLGIKLKQGGEVLYKWRWATLFEAWQETSHAMQRLRDNPLCADAERNWRLDDDDPGISPKLSFDPAEDVAAPPFVAAGARPRVAILREQGVNGEVEMAAAFDRAGFEAVDVHMSDLQSGRYQLADFRGFAACGGFSYGDVLGAGRGWAASILYSERLRDAFAAFFADGSRFALGACNGCQMLSQLAPLIPGAEHWPHFERNLSEQYEARLVTLEVMPSPSIFLDGMAGSRIPVVVAHGEGRAVWAAGHKPDKSGGCLRYVDNRGRISEDFPANPNGSPGGLTGFQAADGRVLALMPHPERVFRSVQLSWRPPRWGEDSPWMRLFRNARKWVG